MLSSDSNCSVQAACFRNWRIEELEILFVACYSKPTFFFAAMYFQAFIFMDTLVLAYFVVNVHGLHVNTRSIS